MATSNQPEQRATELATLLGLAAPTFQNAPEMVIAGLNQNYTPQTRSAIAQQWERFVPRSFSIPALDAGMFYGVCWNTKPDCSFDYLAGVQTANGEGLSADLVAVSLAARRYAVFTHTGHVSAIGQTIDTVWSKWAPACGLKLSHAPCYERYTPEFDPQTGLGGMELWIPLEKD